MIIFTNIRIRHQYYQELLVGMVSVEYGKVMAKR